MNRPSPTSTDSSTSSRGPTGSASSTSESDRDQLKRIDRAIASRSFAVLSTCSPAGFPHAAGVLYDSVDMILYVHTMRSSRKATNVLANQRCAVVIPVRRLPVGPPFTVQYQAKARVLAMDQPEILALLEDGELKGISGHGALDESDGCFLRIEPRGSIHSYGIGVSVMGVARDPLHAGARSVTVP